MTLELVNTLVTFGTFLVISATAIAAMVQLRHLRSSNQIAAFNELREYANTEKFKEAEHYLMTDLANAMKDPEFRYQLLNPSSRTLEMQGKLMKMRTVANYYEGMGVLVKRELLESSIALDMFVDNVLRYWDLLWPSIALFRSLEGPAIQENFEYLVVLSQDWNKAHPEGSYPRGVRRLALPYGWQKDDAKYAASRSTR